MNDEKFLELVRDLASPIFFKKELDMSPAAVEKKKKELGVESQDDARRLLKKMQTPAVDRNQEIIAEKKRIEEANLRLRQEELKPSKPSKKPNVNKIKKQDATRQKRFEKEQNKTTAAKLKKKIKVAWTLPASESIDRFKNDIVNRGLQFCVDKYGVDSADEIRFEANRLQLKIDWSVVRR